MKRINVTSATLIALLIFSSTIMWAQSPSPIIKEGTLSWQPKAGQNGVNATAQYRIRYSTFFGEPTEQKVAKITKGRTIHYEGRTYTPETVGLDAWEEIKYGPIDLTFDIYDGPSRVSTVTFGNVVEFDISGSPNWNDVFPGLNEAQAKDLFRRGFSIQNVRISDLSNYSMYKVEKYVEGQQRNREHSQLTEEANQAMTRQDYEEAQELLRSAVRLKPDDAATQAQLDKVQDVIAQERASQIRSEELVQQADRAMKADDPEEAQRLYQQAQQANPENSEATQGYSTASQQVTRQAEITRQNNLNSYRDDRNAQIESNNQAHDESATQLQSSITGAGMAIGGLISQSISNNTDVNYYRGGSSHFGFNVGVDVSSVPVVTDYKSDTYKEDGSSRRLVGSDEKIEMKSPLGTGLTAGITFHPILTEHIGLEAWLQGALGLSPTVLLGGSDDVSEYGSYSSYEDLFYSNLSYGGVFSFGFKPLKFLFSYSLHHNSIDYLYESVSEIDYTGSTDITSSSNRALVTYTEDRLGAGLRFTAYESETTFDLMYYITGASYEGDLIQGIFDMYQLSIWGQSRYRFNVEVSPNFGAVSNDHGYAQIKDMEGFYINIGLAYTIDAFGKSYF